MYPDVPPPANVEILRPVDFKLKPGWRFDEASRAFTGPAGESFTPELPKGAKLVFKVPDLARSRRKNLSPDEKDLQRYMQVVLPSAWKPEEFAKKVKAWPCADAPHAAPVVSLPTNPR